MGLNPLDTAAPGAGEDQLLFERTARGDAAALRSLYDRCSSRALAVAQRVLGVRSEAEEVVQETFVQLWRQATSYDARRGGAMAWVTTIARSRAIDRLRARAAADRAVARLDEPEPPAMPAPLEVAEQRQLRERVLGALSTLPAEQRRAIELAYYEGLSQSEIAARLDAPLGTVKTRVRLGLARLALLLEESAPGAAT